MAGNCTCRGSPRYQVALPRVQPRVLLGHLRQEIATVFSIPVQRVKILFHGMVLKDDRVSLQEYGMDTGSRVTLVVNEPERGHQRGPSQGYAGAQQAPMQQAPVQQQQQGPPQAAQGAPTQVPGQSVPHAAPGFTAAGTEHAPDAPAHQAPAHQAPPEPQLSPEEKHLQQIDEVAQHVRASLLPELEQFEQSIAALPQAKPGQQSATPQDPNAVPPARIPITQRKISELLLRELLKLDGVPIDSDVIRTARKSTVKEIQALLDRTDAAWKSAQETKGIVSDI